MDEPLLMSEYGEGDKRADDYYPGENFSQHSKGSLESRVSGTGRVPSRKRGKQSSFTTILSIWNTMLGSSLVAMPWAVSQAGLYGGALTILVMMFACLYTCALVVKHGRGMSEFYELVSVYVGPIGKFWCWVASVAVLLGVICVYVKIVANCLFGVIGLSESKYWRIELVPIYFVAVMFPILNFKSMDVFVRLNSFGTLSVLALVLFMLYSSFAGPGRPDTPIWEIEHSLFNSDWPKFAGVLSLSFFIHNVILPIMKNARHPEKNLRDLTIAYVLVAISYGICGMSGFIAYGAAPPLEQDYLRIFSSSYVPATIARLFVFFQLCTLYPLILVLCRGQLLSYLFDNEYPSFRIVFVVTILMAVMSAVVPVFVPAVGDIMRWTGCITGLIIVFVLPILVHMNATFPSNPTGIPHTALDSQTDFTNSAASEAENPEELLNHMEPEQRSIVQGDVDETDVEARLAREGLGGSSPSTLAGENGQKQATTVTSTKQTSDLLDTPKAPAHKIDTSLLTPTPSGANLGKDGAEYAPILTAGGVALLAAKKSAGSGAIFVLGPTGHVVEVYPRRSLRFALSLLFHTLFLAGAFYIVVGNLA
eukprot:gb/GEZN01005328.1/.p1 GENE.gb/GEZN01005328.1/~~gb/GEZN01005328.1/.p1  ORF type:complete len:600 (-),score=49.98 gb/GEZN01005328.1/:21-1796(-)